MQGYDFSNVRVGFNRGGQHRLAANFLVEHGPFYSGHKTSFSASRGRMNVTSQLSFEPRYTVDIVDLREGSFTNNLFGMRGTYTMTPLMFVSALVQYNSAVRQASANIRLRWEYRPGSEFFIVFNEQRDTNTPRFPELANRSFVVKFNRLLRF